LAGNVARSVSYCTQYSIINIWTGRHHLGGLAVRREDKNWIHLAQNKFSGGLL
jgi:hypothetical protein